MDDEEATPARPLNALLAATTGKAATGASGPGDTLFEKPLPSIEEMCLRMPLYTTVTITDRDMLSQMKTGTVQFDAYCVMCEKDSTFRTRRSSGGGAGLPRDPDWMLKPRDFDIEVFCQRSATHRCLFSFHYSGKHLIKYGQLPSLEDIAGADIRKYQRLLPEGYFSELKRATGLASHGIGIGAFVYLRRIFERLIADHRANLKDDDVPENFDGLRMDEKIQALKSELPPALVENRAAYGILSKGIHELDEETCKKHFGVVRQAIITILEQDYQRRRQEEETKRLREEIARISGELK